jgi:hypothetical protein
MKRIVCLLTLIAGSMLVGAPAANAGDHFRVGFDVGLGFGHRSHFHAGFHSPRYHPHRTFGHVSYGHNCVKVPIYGQVWVPPRYENVFSGYDHCGRPIYRTVCVSQGYYRTAVTGYRCSICGH